MSDSRICQYKNNDKDFEVLRKQRFDQLTLLRKAKRGNDLSIRRNIEEDNDVVYIGEDDHIMQSKMKVESVLMGLHSEERAVKTEALTECRKMVSYPKYAVIEEFCERGVVEVLYNLAITSVNEECITDDIFESVWALCNIAVNGNRKHSQAVVDAGAIPLLISLCSSTIPMLVEQSLWTLASLISDSTEHCLLALSHSLAQPLAHILRSAAATDPALASAAWLTSRLCHHPMRPYPLAVVKELLLPAIGHRLTSTQSPLPIPVVADLVWALSHAADNCTRDLVPLILPLLPVMLSADISRSAPDIAEAVLALLYFVMSGSEDEVTSVITAGALEFLSSLFDTASSYIVEQCCNLLRTTIRNCENHFDRVIRSGLIGKTLLVLKDATYKAQRDAAWIIYGFTVSCNDRYRLFLLENGIFRFIVPGLNLNFDGATCSLLLDCLDDLLGTAEQNNLLENCAILFEEVEGLNVLEKLQDSENEDLSERSSQILCRYFGQEEDDLAEEVQTSDAMVFEF